MNLFQYSDLQLLVIKHIQFVFHIKYIVRNYAIIKFSFNFYFCDIFKNTLIIFTLILHNFLKYNVIEIRNLNSFYKIQLKYNIFLTIFQITSRLTKNFQKCFRQISF